MTVAVIILIGYLHRGFKGYWPEVLILAIDFAVNVVVRVLLARRRRALGLSRTQRRFRLGLGPPPVEVG